MEKLTSQDQIEEAGVSKINYDEQFEQRNEKVEAKLEQFGTFDYSRPELEVEGAEWLDQK